MHFISIKDKISNLKSSFFNDIYKKIVILDFVNSINENKK